MSGDVIEQTGPDVIAGAVADGIDLFDRGMDVRGDRVSERISAGHRFFSFRII